MIVSFGSAKSLYVELEFIVITGRISAAIENHNVN
jgi:hypothetical protein